MRRQSHAQVVSRSKEELRRLFEEIDADGSGGITKDEEALFVEMLPELLNALGTSDARAAEQTDTMYHRQTALLTIDILSRSFASSYPDAFAGAQWILEEQSKSPNKRIRK